ncbi:hypothetical protein Ancab_028324 [Ancistrocladus abbreviatus]
MEMAIERIINPLGRILHEICWLSEEMEDEMEDLAAQLNFLNAFIKNSEEKRDQNYVVGETVQQLTNVAQEAQDVINDFKLAVDNQRRSSILQKIGRCKDHISILHNVARRTQKIKKTIKNIFDNFQRFGISMDVGVWSRPGPITRSIYLRKLCLYPKGNLRGKNRYLSLYLYLEHANDLIDGRKLYVEFVLSIKDQLTDSDHEKSVGYWFDSDKDHQGFDDFLPLTELNNPLKGYKANGTVIIAATINQMFLVTQVS